MSRSAPPCRAFLLAVACLAALSAGPPARSAQVLSGLFVTYTSGVVSVTLADGTPVGAPTAPGTIIPPGTYDVDILVKAGLPYFQLSGPGVDLLDNMPAENVYTVTFAPGSTYTYQDDSEGTSTRMVFTTSSAASPGASSTPTTTSTGSTSANTGVVGADTRPVVLRGTLDVTVSPPGRLSLTKYGNAVTRFASGRYKVIVTDRSGKAGLELRHAGAQAVSLTGQSFVGKRTFVVSLTGGHWSLTAGGSTGIAFVVTA